MKDVKRMSAVSVGSAKYNQALRLAVEALEARLAGVSITNNQLDAGDVWSALQDVCIDVGLALGLTRENTDSTRRMTYHTLPDTLRDLYVDARTRSTTSARSGKSYRVNFGTAGLTHTIRTSLAKLIPAL